MSLFDMLGRPSAPAQNAQRPQQFNPMQMQRAFQSDLASLKADPIAYAKAHGKNIPDGMTDPNQMAQYLLNSTQVNNPRYQMAVRMLNGMRR